MIKANKYQTMIAALKNELAIDAFDMINVYLERKCKIAVLKPIHLMEKFKSNFSLKLFLYSLSLLWVFIFPLLMFYKFLKYSLLLKSKCTISLASGINIATSHRLQDTYNGIDGLDKPIQWLVVPWVTIDKIDFNSKHQKIELLSLLTFLDVLKALLYSFKGILIWVRNIKELTEILHSYVLFEYFLMVAGLNKLKSNGVTEYWYTNHYDRWSVLLDNSSKSNILLQHGFVNERFHLPYKLKNIKKFYYIDEKSIPIFKKNIIEWNNNIETVQLKNTLKLQKIDDKGESILIVSRPAQLEFDKELVSRLKDFNVLIYIKPHPLFDKEPYRDAFSQNAQCVLIEDNNFYPDVKVVLSGYSTLAVEYELLGKKIIWISQESIESILEKLKKENNV